jgi:hypothetical protein
LTMTVVDISGRRSCEVTSALPSGNDGRRRSRPLKEYVGPRPSD